MKCVVNLFDKAHPGFTRWEHGEHYAGAEAPLAKPWGAEALGFHIEILDPGKFSCPYHRHEKEEELFIALEGSATVRQDGEFFAVSAGDLFFFKKGVTHQIYNHTSKPFRFFALSNDHPEEVCDYPDSRKKLETKLDRITQDGVEVDDYWKDEEDPRSHWPADILGEQQR
jgi:uncharacterized cupin superfamily protein